MECGNGEVYNVPGGYTIEFSGFQADEVNGQTCFYYCVSNNDVSPAISHINFGKEECGETCLDELSNSECWIMGVYKWRKLFMWLGMELQRWAMIQRQDYAV